MTERTAAVLGRPVLWVRTSWVQASRSGAPDSRAPRTGGVRPAGLSGPPSAGPPGLRVPGPQGQGARSSGGWAAKQAAQRVSGGTRGPSAWVPRTAASAVLGAVPPGAPGNVPRPARTPRPTLPAPAVRVPVPGPDPDRAREGGGAGISGPLPPRSPRPARGSEDPWARGWRGSLVLVVPERVTRPHWAGAAPRGAGALSGCCPARVRGVGLARGSHGRISQPRPRLGGQCPGG